MTQKLSKVEQLEEERQLYKTVFENPSGRKILDRLEHLGYFRRTTYTSANASETALFNEGKRSIVLHIKNMLDDKMIENLKQNIEKEKS